MVLMVGFASVTEWDDEKGTPRNGVSVGCPLLSPNDFKLLKQKMAGFKNFSELSILDLFLFGFFKK